MKSSCHSKSVDELEKIILLQQQEIQRQQMEITSQKERYVRLLEEFKLEKSHRYGASSEKNIHQLDLFDETGIDLVGELKDQLDDTIDIESYQRKKHPVRRPIPKDMPREIIIHDIAEHEKVCDCGAHLVRIGEVISAGMRHLVIAKLNSAH